MKVFYTFIAMIITCSLYLKAFLPYSSQAKPDSPVIINMVYYRETAEPLLKKHTAIFEQQSGHKVNLVYIRIEDLKHLLLKGEMKGTLPDIVFAPSDLISLAKVINLSPIPKKLLVKELQADAIQSVEFMGTPHGIPMLGGNHLVLYYNKKYVKTPARTWQELRQQEAALTALGVKTLGMYYSAMYWFTAFAGTFGGAPISDGKITLNTQAYMDALAFYKELSTSGFVSARCSFDCGHKDFIAEKFAYAIDGEWSLLELQKSMGDDLGISVIPAIGDKPFRPLFSTVALQFPGNSLSGPKQQALSALALYFQSKACQDTLHSEAKLLPVRKDSFQQLEANADPNLKMLLTQLKQAKPMLADAMMSSAWAGMQKGWSRYMKGVLSAKDAVAYMQTFAERDYKKSLSRSK